MVRCGDDAGHEYCIDEATCDGTSGLNEDYREWAGSGVSVRETGVVVRHIQADDDDGYDVEEDDAPEDVADHTGKILGWVFGLSGCDSNGFGAAAAVC